MSLVATLAGYSAALPFLLTILLLAGGQAALGSRVCDGSIRFLIRALLLTFGVRIRISGHRAPRGTGQHTADGRAAEPRLYMANHVSLLDPLILFVALPGGTRGVELEDHFSWPVWGAITRLTGTIPISHRSTRRAMVSLRRVACVLDRGASVAILPEGHRTRTGEMGRFMRGPFRLAHQTHVPIVPLALRGLYGIKNVHSLRMRPGVVTVAFGRPMDPEQLSALSDHQAAELVRARIQALLDR